MSKKYKIYAVTKTHWDREWYMDFQKTRIKLVHLIDSLLDILDNDPDFVSFMMDGQTLPLEDYLEVKPYNREKLKKYINEGRIIIGPWYILPDEILITGETHIRNYLLGSRVAKSFDANKMEIGYLPDSFGHPSQMPQILNKLGMNSIMFWRGATEDIDKTEFYWRAPDGTRILTVLMPDGYFTGAELNEDASIVAKRLDNYIEHFAKLSNTDIIYLSNGGDHLEPVPYLSRVLKEANEMMEKGNVRHTTLPKFMKDLQSTLGDDVKEVTGELCGVHYSILLASTTSTRMYLKQENHFTSRLLESYLEPTFSVLSQFGNEYPRDILVRAWKYFMENQPHDSICGCSVDAIHRDMLFRYNQVKEIGKHMLEIATSNYKEVDVSSFAGDYALVINNSFGASRTDYLEADVQFDARPTSINDYEHSDEKGNFPLHYVDNNPNALKPLPIAVKVFDGEQEIPCQMLDATVENWLNLGYKRFPHQYNVNRCRIGFIAKDVPAVGYKTLRVVPVYEDITEKKFTSDFIENEYYKIIPAIDGTISVTDKETGRELKRLNLLADGGDCGDEYTYCPPDEDKTVFPDQDTISASVICKNDVFQTLEMKGIIRIPVDVQDRSKSRTEETNDCAFTTKITVYSNIKRIDIKTTVDNRCKYHRLRVLFPTSILSENSWSAGTFSVDKRPVVPHIDPAWKELYYTHPQKDFCDVNDGNYGIAIANRGLHEFEAYNDNDETILAITLLRCTGVISQRVIKTRFEMGGWSEKAPEGQCIGTWDFEYSIMPHTGTWEEAEIYKAAREYNVPMCAVQPTETGNGTLPLSASVISIENPELLVSAFKQCEFEDNFIFRFYNSTGKHIKAVVNFKLPFTRIDLSNLREESLQSIPVNAGKINIDVNPFEIITLKIVK